MIQNIEIKGQRVEVGAELQKYAVRKIGRLDRFFPRHARESTRAEVLFKEETKGKTKKNYTCEVILHLPGEIMTTHETTMNMFAAVDIVEAKLKNQLKKYKEMHSSLRLHRRVLARIRRGS